MPTLHLVVDEVVPVVRHRFRVRVWRRADSPPVVLLSQVPGHPPPDWCSSQLANLVLRTFLGYTAVIPAFFELSRRDGQTRAFRVTYDTIGCNLRPILVNPRYDPLDPALIERVFGRTPDTRNRKGHADGASRVGHQTGFPPCAPGGDRRYPPASKNPWPASG